MIDQPKLLIYLSDAGRCAGAVIGAYIHFGDGDIVHSLRFVYRCMAVAAAIVATLYFILYHGLLKPRCHAHTIQGPRQPPTIVQGKRFLMICIHANRVLFPSKYTLRLLFRKLP